MDTKVIKETKTEKGYGIIRVFLAGFSLVLCIVLGVAITGTHHNVVWYKEAFVTAVWMAAIAVLFLILRKCEAWFSRYEKQVFCAVCLMWGIALYIFSCFARSEPVTDYRSVWTSALALASGGEVDWIYFAIWKNNFFVMLLLAGLVRVSSFLGIEDPFFLILFFAVLLTVWAGICVYQVLQMAGQSVSVRFFGLLLFIGFVPVWGGTQNFYTDTMSLCFGIWSVRILFSALKNDLKISRFFLGGVLEA